MIDWSFQSQLTRYAPQLSVHHWMVLESGACGERERERESKVDATVCITNCNIAALLESSLEASPLVRVRVYRHPHCV